MSCFKNALLFGDRNFSSGDHFTKGSRQKATSEKLELGALAYMHVFLTKHVKKHCVVYINLLYCFAH